MEKFFELSYLSNKAEGLADRRAELSRCLSAQLHAGLCYSAQDKAELERIDERLADIHNQMRELNK